MRVSIGGDRFLVVRGSGEPDPAHFPDLPEGFNGWVYIGEERPTELYYFNYLGDRVPFCGNATRVVGYLSLNGRNGEIVVDAHGPKVVKVRGDYVGITLDLAVNVRGDHSLVEMEGVKHLVVPVVGRMEDFPLREFYRATVKGGMPYHTNVYTLVGDSLFVRTWEYGYPEEPLGCATGTLSSAADFLLRHGLNRVKTVVRSGDVGMVSGDGRTFTMWHRIYPL